MINYSIIIPHKNIPDLLQRCLNSIPHRDDIQIIVVDDNSDSDKVDFAHFPGLGEKCVEIYFTKEGKGAGYARNVGLEHAKGKWLLFADADDFFTENFEVVIDKYVNSPFDLVYLKVDSVFCDTLAPSDRGYLINKMIDCAYRTQQYDSLRYQRLEPWAKIILRSLIENHNIVFDETLAANDLMFSVTVAHFASKVTVDCNHFYCLTERAGSLAYSVNRDICEAKFGVTLRLNDFLDKIGKSRYRSNIFHYVWQFHFISLRLMFEKGRKVFASTSFLRSLWDCCYYCAHLLKTWIFSFK